MGTILLPPNAILSLIQLTSLSATVLRLRISGALRTSEDPSIRGAAQLIDQATVYKHPTVESLANFVVGLINNSGKDADPTIAISQMIEKYSQGMDVPIESLTNGVGSHNKGVVVLLTGSTGNLGAQMLASLIPNDAVARVYTLNRSSTRMSMLDRHKERFEDKSLDTNLLSSKKLIFLEGEASQSHLGLQYDLYSEVRRPQLLFFVTTPYVFALASTKHNTNHTQCLEVRFQPSFIVLRTADSWYSESHRFCARIYTCLIPAVLIHLLDCVYSILEHSNTRIVS